MWKVPQLLKLFADPLPFSLWTWCFYILGLKGGPYGLTRVLYNATHSGSTHPKTERH